MNSPKKFSRFDDRKRRVEQILWAQAELALDGKSNGSATFMGEVSGYDRYDDQKAHRAAMLLNVIRETRTYSRAINGVALPNITRVCIKYGLTQKELTEGQALPLPESMIPDQYSETKGCKAPESFSVAEEENDPSMSPQEVATGLARNKAILALADKPDPSNGEPAVATVETVTPLPNGYSFKASVTASRTVALVTVEGITYKGVCDTLTKNLATINPGGVRDPGRPVTENMGPCDEVRNLAAN